MLAALLQKRASGLKALVQWYYQSRRATKLLCTFSNLSRTQLNCVAFLQVGWPAEEADDRGDCELRAHSKARPHDVGACSGESNQDDRAREGSILCGQDEALRADSVPRRAG